MARASAAGLQKILAVKIEYTKFTRDRGTSGRAAGPGSEPGPTDPESGVLSTAFAKSVVLHVSLREADPAVAARPRPDHYQKAPSEGRDLAFWSVRRISFRHLTQKNPLPTGSNALLIGYGGLERVGAKGKRTGNVRAEERHEGTPAMHSL